jgi:hypothetical protein
MGLSARRHLTLVSVLVTVLAAGAAFHSAQPPAAVNKAAQYKAEAKERWAAELKTVLPVGKATKEAIEKRMMSSSRDHAIYFRGGTGAKSLYYLIDDFHQIAFHLDESNILAAQPAISDHRPWLKDRDGSLLTEP